MRIAITTSGTVGLAEWIIHGTHMLFYFFQGVPNEHWSLCRLNEKYALCPTYPSVLIVPSIASDSLIRGCVNFRSKGRLPVLTYLHKNHAAIIRCAQPLVGISGMRSAHDEKYVDCLLKSTPGSNQLQIIDTRPQMNALANMAGGKGYENEKYYEHTQLQFRGIENIHKMRNSMKTLMSSVTVCVTVESFLTELASSGWLKHIKSVLDSSVAIMNCILDNKSVIVHCSDGWDRTAQTCSLACLMLDGHYRTILGFQALIEKDWLAFGHKFTDRLGIIQGPPEEVSPTFGQFLDATWQLHRMHPESFQFNEKYLIDIHEAAYSSQYGTFLGNCEKERAELEVRGQTFSLWGHLIANHDNYSNPLYDPMTQSQVIQPSTCPQNIKFWSGLYSRFDNGRFNKSSSNLTNSTNLVNKDQIASLTKNLSNFQVTDF